MTVLEASPPVTTEIKGQVDLVRHVIWKVPIIRSPMGMLSGTDPNLYWQVLRQVAAVHRTAVQLAPIVRQEVMLHSAPLKIQNLRILRIFGYEYWKGNKTMRTINTKNTVAFLTLTAIVGGILPADAQRERPSRDERREQRQERRQDLTPEQRRQQWQQRMQNMTPEQRQRWEARRAQMEQMQRQEQLASVSGEERQKHLLNSAGVESTEVQDAILAFVIEQAKQRVSVTEAALALSNRLADKAASPEAINTDLEKLTAASKAFRAWKEGALKELDTKVSFSQNPRVKSLLVLVGIIGDESSDAGGFNVIFPKGLAGGGDIAELLPRPEGGGWGGGRGGGNRDGGGNQQGNAEANAEAPTAEAPAPVNN